MSKTSIFHLPIPPFIYGTAWKKDQTASLVHLALSNNFTAIDTACQPRHYREDLVGDGVRSFLSSNNTLARKDLFIQSKFTSIHGQDPNNIPYNSTSPLTEQVHQSVARSLQNFTIGNDTEGAYLDSLVLHSPMPTLDETLEVWRTLETYVPGKIRALGISNTNLYTLMDLHERATVKPSFVQNRFYADSKYDIALRKFCGEKGLIYQSFWTLTANPALAKSKLVDLVAKRLDVSPTSALYCLVLGLGNTVVLNGTKSERHMAEDWEAVQRLDAFVEQRENKQFWDESVKQFRKDLGEAVN